MALGDAVQQIKERLDILEVIGGYVELQKAGKQYKGKSPFTSEKTPSFFVSPDRGMYYCFSSQKGGDMFTFIEEMEGVDFKGALKILAEKAGVELVPEDPKKRDARDAQYALLEAATMFFFREREKRPEVTTYVTKRGVKGETQHVWRIGYAPDEWRALRAHLSEQGFTDEQILRAGLIKTTEGGKEPYDVFRDRVMFPISDASGRVVAFSGRTLKKEEGVPKYVNSPETELFQKSEILYGYDKAKQGIRHYDFSLIVEGQFDVVLSHQAGYTNAVAVSGTALTPHHIMLLSRLSGNVVLALDADRAGISAMKRSAFPMLAQGLDIKVAHLPDGQDPADIIKEDPKTFRTMIGHAEPVIDYLLAHLKGMSRDERTYKLEAREEILPLLLAIPNRIDREYFEGRVAEAIDTTREAVHYEVERLALEREREPANTPAPERQASREGEVSNRKRNLTVHLLSLESLIKETHKKIHGELVIHLTDLVAPEEQEAIVARDQAHMSKALFTNEQRLADLDERQLAEELSDALTQLAHLKARERLATLREELRVLEAGDDDRELIHCLEETKRAENWLKKSILVEP